MPTLQGYTVDQALRIIMLFTIHVHGNLYGLNIVLFVRIVLIVRAIQEEIFASEL